MGSRKIKAVTNEKKTIRQCGTNKTLRKEEI